MWQRFKEWWYKSWTILWNGFCVVVAAVLTFVDQFISDPTIKDQLNVIFTPKVVAAIVVVMGIGSVLARMRTLGK